MGKSAIISNVNGVFYPLLLSLILRIFKFQSVNHLSLFIPINQSGSDRTIVSFIGLYGEFRQQRVGAVDALYEAKPMLADHKSEIGKFTASYKPGF